MKPFLDRFILSIPRLFIKQFPYAWIIFIALWSWPPNFSFIFLLIILIGLSMLRWQSAAWLSNLRREYAPGDGKFYIDQPSIPLKKAMQNLSILVVVSAALAFLLKGQFGLNSWQIFFMMVGFSIFYRDALFFGAPVKYVITASGIGIHYAPGHLDYRLFLTFKEISRIERCAFQKDKGWDNFARTQNATDGLLLIPKDPNGFSKRLERLFIVPKDIETFLEQLPYGFGRYK
jgi:hypothetical protein